MSFRLLLPIFLAMVTSYSFAETIKTYDGFDIYYSIVPSTFISGEIADRYKIIRGKDRSFLNVAIVGKTGSAVEADIVGSIKNLLDQTQDLAFRKVKEGNAIYYLHELKHSDDELLRFSAQIALPNGRLEKLMFSKKLYWNDE